MRVHLHSSWLCTFLFVVPGCLGIPTAGPITAAQQREADEAVGKEKVLVTPAEVDARRTGAGMWVRKSGSVLIEVWEA